MKHNDFEQSARQLGMVRVRGGFSDVNKIAPCNKEMQIYEFDDDVRVSLCNELYFIINRIFNNPGDYFYDYKLDRIMLSFCKSVLNDVFCEINYSGQLYWQSIFDHKIALVIKKAVFNEVLDTVEYIAQWFEMVINRKKGWIYADINNFFEREYIGYRFIDGSIVQITDKVEIESIEKSLAVPFEGCRSHIRKAVGFLADREKKDYKNSIKESISAVESICQIIVENEKAVLSDALKRLEANGTKIHPALREGFKKIYSYTSDQGGIRHAEGMFESNVTFEEAEFMLVSCSAFVNYLIAEYGKRSK